MKDLCAFEKWVYFLKQNKISMWNFHKCYLGSIKMLENWESLQSLKKLKLKLHFGGIFFFDTPIRLKRTYGHVLVLPTWCLVHPTAHDGFWKFQLNDFYQIIVPYHAAKIEKCGKGEKFTHTHTHTHTHMHGCTHACTHTHIHTHRHFPLVQPK